MDKIDRIKKKKISEDKIEYGYYYLPSEVCKDYIISAGLCGVEGAKAVKKIRKKINCEKGAMEKIIPALRSMDQDIVSYYAGELAECLVYAAGKGKGVEIAMGYPKIFVISVN
jgi:hypothetical protein